MTTPTPPPAAPAPTALVIDQLSLGLAALGGAEWRKSACTCDPDVGMAPCEYCVLHHAVTNAITHLAELQARCARLEEDGKRLDWLDKKGLGTSPRAWAVFEYENNVRAAIDAAREGQKS